MYIESGSKYLIELKITIKLKLYDKKMKRKPSVSREKSSKCERPFDRDHTNAVT